MSLIERFSEYVRACFTGLWIESARKNGDWPHGILIKACGSMACRWKILVLIRWPQSGH